MCHPFVFQVQGHSITEDLDRAAEELLDRLPDQPIQLSYGRSGKPFVLGVVDECDEFDAGRLIDNLQQLSVAHPMIRVSLGGFGSELPPTVLEHGRFVLFGEAYRSFCANSN
jgi:hypothetical protein